MKQTIILYEDDIKKVIAQKFNVDSGDVRISDKEVTVVIETEMQNHDL